MRVLRIACSAGFLALLGIAPVVGGERDQPFNTGLLWRISKPGTADSFVFGTIHVSDPRVAVLAKPVEDALRHSRTLAIELVPEAADGLVLELEQLDDGQRLETLIGATAFERIRATLAAQRIPLPVIERMKPWAAMVKITRIDAPATGPSLDEQLLSAARERRLRVMSLELVDEQIAAFDAVPLASQIAMLEHALAHHDALAAAIEPTIDAWLRGDLASLAGIPERLGRRFPGMAEHYGIFAKHVVDDRTVLMHYRLFMPLREGRVFAAIGATHLYGDKGLLRMLQQDGYRVKRVP